MNDNDDKQVEFGIGEKQIIAQSVANRINIDNLTQNIEYLQKDLENISEAMTQMIDSCE